MTTVFLAPAKDRPVRQRHPWIFSGAIDRVEGPIVLGDLVDVADARGEWLARGYFNPRSQIEVRLLTWERAEPVDAAFWRRRLVAAGAARAALAADPHTTAYRLVYAESDGVPGLIVDRYGDWLVVQFLTAGVEVRRDERGHQRDRTQARAARQPDLSSGCRAPGRSPRGEASRVPDDG